MRPVSSELSLLKECRVLKGLIQPDLGVSLEESPVSTHAQKVLETAGEGSVSATLEFARVKLRSRGLNVGWVPSIKYRSSNEVRSGRVSQCKLDWCEKAFGDIGDSLKRLYRLLLASTDNGFEVIAGNSL